MNTRPDIQDGQNKTFLSGFPISLDAACEISEARTRLGVVLLRDYSMPELLGVKHRIDARTDPEKARRETVEWGQAPTRHAPLSGDKGAWRLSPASTA
jgi:hypothetical protein